MRAVAVFFALAAVVHGGPEPTATDVFKKALAKQGGVRRDAIRDVHLNFRGQVVHKDGKNTIERDYWFRSADGSFRIRTTPGARVQSRTDRGVLADTFWEAGRKRVYVLSEGNRDDRGSIETIRSDRRDFERIVRLVLLTRLEGKDTAFRFAAKAPVQLPRDTPFSARQILGKDRAAHSYHVLSVERPGEPRLVLFVHTEDYTVRKVVQYHPRRPNEPEWYYYFGPHMKSPSALDMVLPRFFSVHTGVPTDTKSRDKTASVSGEIEVSLNSGLENAVFKPG